MVANGWKQLRISHHTKHQACCFPPHTFPHPSPVPHPDPQGSFSPQISAGPTEKPTWSADFQTCSPLSSSSEGTWLFMVKEGMTSGGRTGRQGLGSEGLCNVDRSHRQCHVPTHNSQPGATGTCRLAGTEVHTGPYPTPPTKHT